MPRIIDNVIASAYRKSIFDAEGHRIKVEPSSAIALRLKLRDARPFYFTDRSIYASQRLVDGGYGLMYDLLPRVRLPSAITWIEPLSFAEGNLPDDIYREGFLIMAEPKVGDAAFRICNYYYATQDSGEESVSWAAADIIVDPLHKMMEVTPNLIPGDMQQDDIADLLKLVQHFTIVEPKYPSVRKLTLSRMYNTLGAERYKGFVEDCGQLALRAMAQLTLFNVGGRMQPEVVDGKTATMEPKQRPEYLDHKIVYINLTDRQIDNAIKKLAGFGVRHRRHPVIAHWCVSRRIGNPDCYNVKRICRPRVIDADHNICETCGKPEWHRVEMERGDATLGYIIHDYVVDTGEQV